jgi:hypothetical protein
VVPSTFIGSAYRALIEGYLSGIVFLPLEGDGNMSTPVVAVLVRTRSHNRHRSRKLQGLCL